MKSTEIYKRFLLKINKNDTNEGINILPGIFVLMFNTEAQRWEGERLNTYGDSIKLDYLSTLFKSDVKLKQVAKDDDWIQFELPDDFYRHSSSFAFADKGNCTGVKIFYFEKKTLGSSVHVADDFSTAHFDYEEAPFIITGNTIKAYTDDYKVTKFLTSYYKIPIPIDIAGYTRQDGTPSKDIDTDLDDFLIEEILNRLTLEAVREFENNEGAAFAQNRIQTEP